MIIYKGKFYVHGHKFYYFNSNRIAEQRAMVFRGGIFIIMQKRGYRKLNKHLKLKINKLFSS